MAIAAYFGDNTDALAKGCQTNCDYCKNRKRVEQGIKKFNAAQLRRNTSRFGGTDVRGSSAGNYGFNEGDDGSVNRDEERSPKPGPSGIEVLQQMFAERRAQTDTSRSTATPPPKRPRTTHNAFEVMFCACKEVSSTKIADLTPKSRESYRQKIEAELRTNRDGFSCPQGRRYIREPKEESVYLEYNFVLCEASNAKAYATKAAGIIMTIRKCTKEKRPFEQLQRADRMYECTEAM